MSNEMYDPAGLDASDTLDGDPGDDPLDQGIAPPDRWSAGERFGTTAGEEQEGESLDELLAEEEPDTDPYADSGDGDEDEDEDEDGEDRRADDLWGDGEPEARSGRLVADDEGAHPDDEEDLVAHDVGIDGGAASAEEAAVHVQDEDEG
jgi:Family of unknown function (DUF5709)